MEITVAVDEEDSQSHQPMSPVTIGTACQVASSHTFEQRRNNGALNDNLGLFFPIIITNYMLVILGIICQIAGPRTVPSVHSINIYCPTFEMGTG